MPLHPSDNILVVIPARLGSTRLQNKLLREINGQSVIRHTINQVTQCVHVSHMVLATDSQLIADHVAGYNCDVVITDASHSCGTDRCAAIIDRYPEHDIIINVQGDQPFIESGIIDTLILHMISHPEDQLCSLMSESICDIPDSNIVKVSTDDEGLAIAFSRTPQDVETHQHIGVYGYRRNELIRISQLPTTQSEQVHRLEQLRWLDHGHVIRMVQVDHIPLSIDVASDLHKANNQSHS